MNEQGILHYANVMDLGSLSAPDNNGWMMTACPLAFWTHQSRGDSHPSFGIKIEDGSRSHYHCFTCKQKGTLTNLAYKLAAYRDDPELREVAIEIQNQETSNTGAHLPDWDDADFDAGPRTEAKASHRKHLRKYPFFTESDDAIAYVRRRGISFMEALFLQLRYDPRQHRLLFPIFDRRQRFCGFNGRALSDDIQPKSRDYLGLDKEMLLYGEDYIDRHIMDIRYIIVVEGAIDRAVMCSLGYRNTVALLGSILTEGKMQTIIGWNKPIVWMVDNDQAGEDCLYGPRDVDDEHQLKRGALHKLYNHIPQFTVAYPDGVKDPGELTKPIVDDMLADREFYLIPP